MNFTSNLHQRNERVDTQSNGVNYSARELIDLVLMQVLGSPLQSPLSLAEIPSEGLVIRIDALGTADAFKAAMLDCSLNTFVASVEGEEFVLRWKPKSVSGVSIVSPVYNNQADDFDEFLDSVILSFSELKSENKELILVDDFSRNRQELRNQASKFTQKFEQQKIKLIWIGKDKNSGPAETRNMGALSATHENLLFLDSDDLIHPLYLQLFGQELDSGTSFLSCNMSFADGSFFKAKTSDFKATLTENSNGSCIGIRKNHPVVLKLLGANELYTKKRLTHYEDWELNIVLKGLGLHLSVLPIPLYFYRVQASGRDSSKSHLQVQSRFECVESAWARINKFAEIDQVHKLTPIFLAANGFPRFKRLTFGLHKMERLIWPGSTPEWWRNLKIKTKNLLKKNGYPQE